MLGKIFLYSIQISILLTEAALNLSQTEATAPILNTETTVLSLGDPDDAKNDDLEIIKSPPGKAALERKLNKFHRYVTSVEMTEGPKEKFLYDPVNRYTHMTEKNHRQFLSNFPSPYPPAEPEEEKFLNQTVRKRKKKRKKKKFRKIKYRQLRGNPRTLKKRQVTKLRKKKKKPCTFLDKEYVDYVNHSMRDQTAFKYTDEGKPEDTIKEVIFKMTDVKTPKNCSQYNGVGVQAIECIVEKFKKGEVPQGQMIYAIFVIVLIWFGVYLAAVLPLWCLKGWCCCCCCCEFCRPKKTVKQIEKYLAKNPPGVHTTPSGAEKCHNPTQKEIELYEQLRRMIAEF